MCFVFHLFQTKRCDLVRRTPGTRVQVKKIGCVPSLLRRVPGYRGTRVPGLSSDFFGTRVCIFFNSDICWSRLGTKPSGRITPEKIRPKPSSMFNFFKNFFLPSSIFVLGLRVPGSRDMAYDTKTCLPCAESSIIVVPLVRGLWFFDTYYY